ncbi:hypothetical protein P154DRAFT_471929 [Amniculicola lignicola CBS 123094]|uniref:HMG box domain-containing protein n=1 Tax=Amniculicola lignicola CBS 123094 TaxID=1392246 RepID=A0A6A5W9L1_9PLEO|nr:hypothetical protein P154DRAFT_471929 [Amniculicola lignicola CBS 123094]
MKAETLVQHHPPTPPSVGTELQSGLHQIAQYNAERNYSYDGAQRHGSAYGSPGPVVHEGVQHRSQSFQQSHADQQGQNFGLGIQYDGYSQSPAYYPHEAHYNGIANDPGMFSGSPPTPHSGIDHEEMVHRTRSGRTVAPSSSPAIADRPKAKPVPKVKKAKPGKSEKPKTPKLTAPLSVLTKDLANVPVRNMEEWVNRSVETRRKEVEKRNGYVTRPMNSFMLYRSAYAERTKQWCLQNNHQVVSSVSGESWPLEPPEIRDRYNEYAKLERMNHQNAHPTYKFSPSKTTMPAKKRKGDYSDEEPSDFEDAEWDPGHRKSRNRSSRRSERASGYPVNHMNPDYFDRPYGGPGGGMHGSWEMTHEGKPVPMSMPMAQADLYGQYFHSSAHPNMGMGATVMEDLRMRRVDTPGASMHFSPGHSLLGLPGGNAADLMQQLHSQTGTPLGEDGQVDPMLLAYDGSHQHDLDLSMGQHPDFRHGHLSMMERELDHDSAHSLLPSQDDFHPDSWQPDPTIAPMGEGSEFDKWMDDHHAG